MSKITGKFSVVAAVVLLLGTVGASAKQQRDDHPSPPPPPRAAPAAPAQHVQRATPSHEQQAPRFVPSAPPAAVQQRVAPPAGARFVPGNSERFTPGGTERYSPGGQVHFGAPPVAQAPQLPLHPSSASAFHGVLPGQYRPAQYQPQRGNWRGPPPGLPANRPWHGGSWHGGYWPPVYYSAYYPLYLTVLPSAYDTYWVGAVPYYYANNVYYTWSAPDGGYVVTNPPPSLSDDDLGVIEAEGNGDAGAASMTQSQEASPDPGVQNTQDAPGAPSAPSGQPDIYVNPLNGQSQEQQASDQYACHAWAVQQSGYEPTNPGAGGDADAYRRATIACFTARGYSAG